jgi:MFS family permease
VSQFVSIIIRVTVSNPTEALNAIAGWFDKKRGIAYGILSTGSSVGGIVFPIMTSRLIPSVGFAWTLRIAAFLILFLLVLACLTVKSRFSLNRQVVTRKQLVAPFHEPEFLALNAGLCLFTFGMFIPINYFVVEATANGMSRGIAQYLVAMFNAARYAPQFPFPFFKHWLMAALHAASLVVSSPDI